MMAKLNVYEIEIETKTVQISNTKRNLEETETKLSNALKNNKINAIYTDELKQKNQKRIKKFKMFLS
jgi:hypothetical protein